MRLHAKQLPKRNISRFSPIPAVPTHFPTEMSLYLSRSEPTLKLSHSVYFRWPCQSVKSTRRRWRLLDVIRYRLSFPAHIGILWHYSKNHSRIIDAGPSATVPAQAWMRPPHSAPDWGFRGRQYDHASEALNKFGMRAPSIPSPHQA